MSQADDENQEQTMTKTIHGKVHGRTIELDEDLGVADGQEVEVQVRLFPGRPRNRAKASSAPAGLADDEEWDSIMERIHRIASGNDGLSSRSGESMNFLLDTDICSAHMRRPAQLNHRFVQYIGRIAISTVTLAELYAGAYSHSRAKRLLTLIADLLQEVHVIDFDAACAETFGRREARCSNGEYPYPNGPHDRHGSSGSQLDPGDT